MASRSSISVIALLLVQSGCNASHEARNMQFGETTSLEQFTSVGTAPMFASMRDGREVIAWVSAPDSSANGRLYISVGGQPPAEIVDPLGPIEAHGESPPKVVTGSGDVLHAIYVVGKEVPGRRFPMSALRHVRSLDGGKTWSSPATVTDDSEFGSHNFHALAAGDSGQVIISWLDGRNGPGKSSAYLTTSRDNGASWSTNVRVDTTEACPCCRTGIAVAPDGTLLLSWRTVLPGNIRDIVVARSTDLGATWSEPVRVHADNWEFNACPHAGPSLKVDERGRVHVSWWTGKEGSAGVWYARSDDGARTFGEPVAIDVAEFSRPSHVQLLVYGDTVVAAWDDGTRQVPRVLLRRSVNGGASFSAPVLLSDTTLASSFPVLAKTPAGVAVAWSATPTPGRTHTRMLLTRRRRRWQGSTMRGCKCDANSPVRNYDS